MPDSLPFAGSKVKPLIASNTGVMDHDVAAPDAAVILGVLSAMATPAVATTAVTVYELMTGTAICSFTSMVILNPALSPPELLALIVYLVKARTGEEKRGGMCVRVFMCACVFMCVFMCAGQ